MFTNTFDNNVTMKGQRKGRMISLPLDLQRAFVLLMETIEEALTASLHKLLCPCCDITIPCVSSSTFRK